PCQSTNGRPSVNFSLTNPPAPATTPPPPMRDLPELQRPAPSRQQRRRSGAKAAAAAAAAAIAAGGPAVFGVTGLSKPLRGLLTGSKIDVITYQVKAANLPVVVSERGSLESAKNEDVRCQVEGQTTIIKIVPEGTAVKKGEVVCELDSSALKDSLTNQ